MSLRFEELDWKPTPRGEISLRRRRDPVLDVDVYEIKLDDEYLMSSTFTAGEIALAELGLAAVHGEDLEIVVGGLGLGYTAQAVLADDRVRSLDVVDALAEVIDWHQRELLPLGAVLNADPRCTLVLGDFFEMAADPTGFGGRRFDAIIVDIDHTPSFLLHPSHAPFYEPPGLRQFSTHLKPGGVFALWSNDPPDDAFVTVLAQVFTDVESHVVSFDNHLQDRKATNTVYVARSIEG
jgi:spermidine synthase